MENVRSEVTGEVTESTREAEAEEAKAPHVPDRPATSEEEELVGDHRVDEEVREHYREMTEIGAQEVGEGRIP
jgi:hypothetical protein